MRAHIAGKGPAVVLLPADLEEPEITRYFEMENTGVTVERV